MFPDFRTLAVDDPRLGILLATVIQNLRLPGGELEIRRMLGESSGLSVRTSMFVVGPNDPDGIACQMGSNVLVAMDGADLRSQVTGLVNGYDPNTFSSVTDEVNGYVISASQVLRNFLTQNGYSLELPAVYGGWSLGGTIANFRCARDLLDFEPGLRKCVTFGSPQVGGESFRRRCQQLAIVRYMNALDWIPLVPSRIASQGHVATFYGARRAWSYQSFAQVHGGCVLSDPGNAVAQQYPPLAVAPSIASLSSAMFTGNLQTTEHDLGTYIYRLAQFLANQIPVNPPTSADTGPAVDGGGIFCPISDSIAPTPQNHRTVDQEMRAMDTAIRQQGVRQDVPQVVIPKERLFSAHRVGRDWVIVFGGEIVGVGPTKRRARALARNGNNTLRSLGRQAFVDTNALGQLFSEYLDDAANPNAGFVPALADQLPNV